MLNDQIPKYPVHEGVKYDCNYCDYKTTWQDNVTAHEIEIHEVVLFDFNLCTIGLLSSIVVLLI